MVISVYLFFSSALTLLVGYQEGYSANEITTLAAVSILSSDSFWHQWLTQIGFLGRPPFVKRFALCYPSVCLVMLVYCHLWPNSWMDQNAIWYRSRPRSIRWGPRFTLKMAVNRWCVYVCALCVLIIAQ